MIGVTLWEYDHIKGLIVYIYLCILISFFHNKAVCLNIFQKMLLTFETTCTKFIVQGNKTVLWKFAYIYY